MKVLEVDIQIRFADVDSLNHVNNVNLQHYFDLGKTDYFRRVLNLAEYNQEESFIIASLSTSFFNQVRFSDSVYVSSCVEKIGNKSITLLQQIISRKNGELKAECRSVMVAFNFSTQSSFEVPEAWRALME